MAQEFLWVEKYRPNKIDDCVLPARLKATFKDFIKQGALPNYTFAGGAGIGKTTAALAIASELETDSLIINASKDGNIDTLRDKMTNFASSISWTGNRKIIILDEADYLNPNSTQPGLRNFMEEFSRNCGFILTCNFPSKLLPALVSRCPTIEFKIDKAEMPKLALQFMKRVEGILTENKVEYDKATLAAFINKWFPDWRRIIGELQRYSAGGKIDSGILSNLADVSLQELIGFMKKKEFSKVRAWAAENCDQTAVFRKFYDAAYDYFTPGFAAYLVILIGKYQYQSAFAVDPEINLSAFLAEAMIESQWKDA